MPAAGRHLRAAWIATVINLDWPSKETAAILDDDERILKSKEELVFLLDQAVSLNMNAVFFQVSPCADAFYKSDILPWSRYLTGVFGKDPGFDPLEFAIEEAHKRNLELHAWFNPYRVSMNMTNETIHSLNIPNSIYMQQPDWIRKAGGRFVLDPGIPQVRKWVVDRVMEVVKNYDVDGIHFDDYFYTESVFGEMKDDTTFAQYNNNRFSDIKDWRRNNTYLLIKEVHKAVTSEKKWVKFGVSPVAIWENKSSAFPQGSNTISEYTSYSRLFADTKKWVEDEILDYIAPQIYFSFANTRAPYAELAAWWDNVCKGKKVHLYIGVALYKVNADSDSYFRGDRAVMEISSQLKYNVTRPGIKGDIMFRMANFDEEKAGDVVNEINTRLWTRPVLIPVMEWKGTKTPASPVKALADKLPGGVSITWEDNDPDTVYYAVYRFDKDENINIALSGAGKNLVATVRKTDNSRQMFFDSTISNASEVTYAISALDRLHNKSKGLVVYGGQSKYFYDVSRSVFWAVSSIDYLYRRGIVIGDGKGSFHPSSLTRRADFVIMLVRTFGLKPVQGTISYEDVSEDAYYSEAVAIARGYGITPDGDNFRPLENITREEMFVMMYKLLMAQGLKLPEPSDESLLMYTDRDDISSDAADALSSLTKAGLMAGAGGGRAEPGAYSTRAQIAVVVFRMISAIGSGQFR
jgi:uncharacterized lipoprotein YddW (UPF0748 family)